MTGHTDTSSKWLIFFFICFGLVLLGIVFFFAHDVNTEKPAAPSGGHGGMILPSDGEYAPHVVRWSIS